MPSGIEAFERQFLGHMIPALDHYFLTAAARWEGKDGNPLNEMRMPCNAIMENEGRMGWDKIIRYKPEISILKFRAGDEIQRNAGDFAPPRHSSAKSKRSVSVTVVGAPGWPFVRRCSRSGLDLLRIRRVSRQDH